MKLAERIKKRWQKKDGGLGSNVASGVKTARTILDETRLMIKALVEKNMASKKIFEIRSRTKKYDVPSIIAALENLSASEGTVWRDYEIIQQTRNTISYTVTTPENAIIEFRGNTNSYRTDESSIEHFIYVAELLHAAKQSEVDIALLSSDPDAQSNAWVAFQAAGIRVFGYTAKNEDREGLASLVKNNDSYSLRVR